MYEEYKKYISIAFIIGCLSLSVFFVASAFHLDTNDTTGQSVITVEGDGEYFAVPDTASFSFTVEKDAVTQKEAKNTGAEIMNKILASLKKDYGMTDKDLKTTNLAINPKYSYPTPPCYGTVCPMMYPQNNNPKIIGYTFTQSVTVKVRNIDKVGDVSSKLAELGATNVYGPDFTLANENTVKDSARADAIKNAKEKANILAKDLGVHLGKITNFSESNNGGMSPMAYGTSVSSDMVREKSVTPNVPTGENKYTSHVSITYKIR